MVSTRSFASLRHSRPGPQVSFAPLPGYESDEKSDHSQGFFEWLNTGGKGAAAKKPHFIRNPLPEGTDEEAPMLMMAGLWDSVTYQGMLFSAPETLRTTLTFVLRQTPKRLS